MDPQLERLLLACPALPTAPAVALDLLARCGVEPVDVRGVAVALARDPALAAKVLKVANQISPKARGRIGSVAAAAQTLGPNALLALALSFSLARGRRRGDVAGPDLALAWRRALHSAAAARALAEQAALDGEEAFAAGLLQDMGLLALHEVARREHDALWAEAGPDHARLAGLERAHFGADHAEAGAFLARAWGLPAELAVAIGASHAPPVDGAPSLAACVALADLIASGALDTARAAAPGAGMSPEAVDRAASRAAHELPMLATGAGDELAEPEACERALAAAREALVMLSFRSANGADRAQETLRTLSRERATLEAATSRDALTGLFNRAYGDATLPALFETSARSGRPLSLALCDLDHFKLVNDGYGHATGDMVLKAVAGAVNRSLRACDAVVRWGGDEILLVLPDTDAPGAAVVAERARQRVAQLALSGPAHEPLRISLSLGHATLAPGLAFGSVAALLEAADGALFAAKRAGRDRAVAA